MRPQRRTGDARSRRAFFRTRHVGGNTGPKGVGDGISAEFCDEDKAFEIEAGVKRSDGVDSCVGGVDGGGADSGGGVLDVGGGAGGSIGGRVSGAGCRSVGSFASVGVGVGGVLGRSGELCFMGGKLCGRP